MGSLRGYSITFRDDDGDNVYSGTLIVTVVNDEVGEKYSDIQLTLNPRPTVYQLGSTTVGVVTIIDNDSPIISIGDGETVTDVGQAMAEYPLTSTFNANSLTLYYYTDAKW